MKTIKNILAEISVFFAVLWDLKWDVILILSVFFILIMAISNIAYLLLHPELIGEYIGKILKGISK